MIDIAIIGYGPVGATLAGLLGRRGLQVGVFDKSRDIYPMPRAVGFDHDAIRIFQEIGVAEALGPAIEPFREGIYSGADRQTIQHVRHMPPPYPLTWPPHFTCDQPGVEAVVRMAIAKMPSVSTHLGWELRSFKDLGESVQLELTDSEGLPQSLQARYLVGCDGGASFVRRQLGVGVENLDYDHPWVVVDVKVEPEHLDRLPSWNVQFCEPERPSTYICCPGNHRRWEFMTLPGEASEGAVEPERLWRLLSRWLKPGEATIWRAAAYRFHALVANPWQVGHVLLAGDSAHMTPPFLGQGMCQGLRDAGNLAWKLADVLQQRAPASLLDTYSAERRPHVIETTRIAKELGRIISERDPVRARQRDAAILAENDGKPRLLIRQNLIPELRHGLIAVGEPLAGRVFPQPRVEVADQADLLFDDLFGPAWRWVIDAQCVDGHQALANQARALGLAIVVVHPKGTARPNDEPGIRHAVDLSGTMRGYWETAGVQAALVRPDHIIYGAAADPSGAERVLAAFAASPARHTEHCNRP